MSDEIFLDMTFDSKLTNLTETIQNLFRSFDNTNLSNKSLENINSSISILIEPKENIISFNPSLFEYIIIIIFVLIFILLSLFNRPTSTRFRV
jgi:hypothetical protein